MSFTIQDVAVTEQNGSFVWQMAARGVPTIQRTFHCDWDDREALVAALIGSEFNEPHGFYAKLNAKDYALYECNGNVTVSGAGTPSQESDRIKYVQAHVEATYELISENTLLSPDVDCDIDVSEEVMLLPAGAKTSSGERLQDSQAIIVSVIEFKFRRWVPEDWWAAWLATKSDYPGGVNSGAIALLGLPCAAETVLFAGISATPAAKHGVWGYEVGLVLKRKTNKDSLTWNKTYKQDGTLEAFDPKPYPQVSFDVTATSATSLGAFLLLRDFLLFVNPNES